MLNCVGEVRGVRHIPGENEKFLLVVETADLQTYELKIQADQLHNVDKYKGLKGKHVKCDVLCTGFNGNVYYRIVGQPVGVAAPGSKAA